MLTRSALPELRGIVAGLRFEEDSIANPAHPVILSSFSSVLLTVRFVATGEDYLLKVKPLARNRPANHAKKRERVTDFQHRESYRSIRNACQILRKTRYFRVYSRDSRAILFLFESLTGGSRGSGACCQTHSATSAASCSLSLEIVLVAATGRAGLSVAEFSPPRRALRGNAANANPRKSCTQQRFFLFSQNRVDR